jgi:uncharacterized protein
MKIKIKDILNSEKGFINISFNDSVEGLDNLINDFVLNGNVVFNGVVRKIKDDVLKLSGKMKFEYDSNCYRCLKNIHKNIEVEIEENLFDGKGLANKDDSFVYEGDYLVIDDILRNYIVLSLPMKLVCYENCEGLCPVCGKNLNEEMCVCTEKDYINPQMEILKKYFE